MSKVVGILGGGQIGMMLAESLRKLGGRTLTYDPDAASPARFRGPFQQGPWSSEDALEAFFDQVDLATYEFENVTLPEGVPHRKRLLPSRDVLTVCQNRLKEKNFLREHGFPMLPFAELSSTVEAAAEAVGYPAILKSVRGGYDGHGQHPVPNSEDAQRLSKRIKALEEADGYRQWVLERKAELHTEVSCVVARSGRQEVSFPLFENVHREGILDLTLFPATLSASDAEQCRKMAMDVARRLQVEGMLTVEMFIVEGAGLSGTPLSDGKYLFVNELAPRPHNSGHITLNACDISQFDALARVLLDAPVVTPEPMSNDTYCMVNLLGDLWLPSSSSEPVETSAAALQGLNVRALAEVPGVLDVVLYGKAEARARRKMGHAVVRGQDAQQARDRAYALRERLALHC